MPSYIELDKQASFPSASNAGKIILGVNTSGQVTTTDSAGSTSAVGGGGGGTGLIIPKPIPYAAQTIGQQHIYAEILPGIPGSILDSWNTGSLKLTYQTSDLTFLNYNPKYFLFVYKGANKYGAHSPSHPTVRINNLKYGKYFAHPPNLSGSYGLGLTALPTYTNFSGGGVSSIYSAYNPTFDKYTTEWSVATGSGQPTNLEGFNPLRYYYAADDVQGSSIAGLGYEFFPWLTSISGSGGFIQTTSPHKYKKLCDTPISGPKPILNLYVKFAIVVQDPANASRYIIGPMSDTVKIYPTAGYFDDGEVIQKYYYGWKTKLA